VDIDKLTEQFPNLFPQKQDDGWFSMLRSWGKPGDDDIRQAGTAIQSPVIDLGSKLDFEQRVLNPNSNPVIDNGDGSVSTHRMAYGEVDGKFVAYPTIVKPKQSKELVQLDDGDALGYALNSGEYRSFKTEDEARSYAEGGYKKFWGLGEKK
jgi:hypothetical protein